MKPIALFFGSNSGNTKASAQQIQAFIGEDLIDLYDVESDSLDLVVDYDFLIMGIPTWDYGNLEPSWEEAWFNLKSQNFKDKMVTLFGQGDQYIYAEWYQDAMGILHDVIIENGGTTVGKWSNDESYDFEASKALTEDKSHFVGLALDEDNQEELSEDRIATWCVQIMGEFGLSELMTG